MGAYSFTAIIAILSSIIAISQFQLQTAIVLILLGIGSWKMTQMLIPKVSQFMLKKRIFGLDINKKGSKGGQKQIPQCVGFAGAIAFSVIGCLITLFLRVWGTTQALLSHIAVLVTVIGTILLGFADDMLDLPWRYKLFFPFFIIMPLVSIYSQSTSIDVIPPFSMILGDKIQLGYLYYLYMTLLGIYQTNTINIYAGINGLQVGQSIIAASGMLVYFAVKCLLIDEISSYQYSIYLLITFLGTSLALMKLNAYPAKIFIGDTFCYFAGIILALASIWGHIPIVCHWFILPQLINFLYSIPQLFGFVECPRHRLTKYNIQTDKLHSIPTNMNLLNLSLRILGPTNEGVLCSKLLYFQSLCCLIPTIHLFTL